MRERTHAEGESGDALVLLRAFLAARTLERLALVLARDDDGERRASRSSALRELAQDGITDHVTAVAIEASILGAAALEALTPAHFPALTSLAIACLEDDPLALEGPLGSLPAGGALDLVDFRMMGDAPGGVTPDRLAALRLPMDALALGLGTAARAAGWARPDALPPVRHLHLELAEVSPHELCALVDLPAFRRARRLTVFDRSGALDKDRLAALGRPWLRWARWAPAIR